MKKLLVNLGLLLIVLNGGQAVAETKKQNPGPQVVVSIKPIHSLVAGVMKGVGEPYLIVKNASSPHTYRLRPSDGRALSNAAIVFWVGPTIEQFLEKPISSFAKKSTLVSLINTEGLVKFKIRQSMEIKTHDDEDKHDEHGHGEHKHDEDKHDEDKHDEDKHDEDKHSEHKHEEHKHDEHKHDEHKHDEHKHDAGQIDSHIWLNPENAKKMVKHIATTLINADPKNTKQYQSNAVAIVTKLDKLSIKISAQLKGVQRKKFLVFHDAYQYFERHFGLKFSGTILVNTNQLIGARQLSKIRKQVRELKIRCIFSEPQFDQRLIKTVAENQNIRLATLDPMGAGLAPDENLYFTMMANMASSFKNCFR